MRKIANILFDKTKENTGLYNICDEQSILPSIPTLIVGWENAKKIYPNASILDWKIDDSTYWTFGKREKRDVYERKLTEFKRFAFNNIIDNVEYIFFDIFLCDEECKEELNKLICDKSTTNKRSAYITKQMVYIYSENDNVIYGIKLDDIEYEGKNKGTVISLINSNNAIQKVRHPGYETSRLFSNNEYIIPYIYFE